MKFPRKTTEIGSCVAVVKENGVPHTGCRPTLIHVDKIRWKASRLAFHLNCHTIAATPVSRKEGLILHHCDHGWCVNPSHLYLGTQKQNMQDRDRRHKTFRSKISESLKGNLNNISGSRAPWSNAERIKARCAMTGNHMGKRKETI